MVLLVENQPFFIDVAVKMNSQLWDAQQSLLKSDQLGGRVFLSCQNHSSG